MKRRTGKNLTGLLRGAVLTAFVLVALFCFFTGVTGVQKGSGEEGRRKLEESIRRTAAACYAVEGIYPPTLEYMEENYGLQVDAERYFVDYRIFASNLMPDITVLEKSGKAGGTDPAGPDGRTADYAP